MYKNFLMILLWLAVSIGGEVDAAMPICVQPISDQTWSGSGTQSFQFSALTFRDADWHDLTYTARQADGLPLPSWLVFHAMTRTFSGNPPAGEAKLSLKVTANDGHNGYGICTFGLNLVNVNDLPAVRTPIADQAWRRGSSQSFQFSSLTFRDRDGDRLTYTARQSNGSALPSWLRFSASTRTFSGTPPAYASTLTIRVTARDGTGGAVNDTFLLTFANRAPVAVHDAVTVIAGQPFTDTLTATDADRHPLTYRIIAQAARGRVVLTNTATGAFTYTPNAGALGSDSFTFRANDGRVDSNLATVTVMIVPANRAPVASSGTLTVVSGAVTNGQLAGSDADGDGLTYTLLSNGAQGVVTLDNPATGAYRYQPNVNASGTDRFTFQVSDGRVLSEVATVEITLLSVTPTGLVGYYPFAGHARDESGQGRHGTVNGATLTTDRIGAANQAYRFASTGHWIDTGYSQATELTNTATIAAWVQSDLAGSETPTRVWASNGGGWGRKGWSCGAKHGDTRNVRFHWQSAGDVMLDTTSRPLQAGQWVHVTCVATASRLQIYINGVLDIETPISTQSVNNGNRVWIGSNPVVSSANFVGAVDDLTLYNHALTPDEIRRLVD
ncbi:MAG: tandem-95 repeat protein [Magnetococcales bacterium]|nr:tandem-95 repeat protein [Magnetococcales bacterium]NGZ07064.1 tandem-95 repeat protein [Magnetococcales bacterium]